MLSPKQIGNLTELQCITAFYELGYRVNVPYGEDSRYDFIADVDGNLIKVQVKSCRLITEDVIKFSCRSTRVNSTHSFHKKYSKQEIDYFATYYNGVCYLIPVEECSDEKTLRLTQTKNGQEKRVNYAVDYELLTQVQKLLNK